MGMLWPELSLELKAESYVPESISGIIKQVSMIGDVSERVNKLDEFVSRLQDEMSKIQVFQRQLPLCMLLLKDAMLALKQETSQYKTRNAYQPVLEEFIPLNKDIIDDKQQEQEQVVVVREEENDCSGRDKKNWMSSVQLWNSDTKTLPNSQGGGDDKDPPCKSNGMTKQQLHTSRKQRRCWSADLHRRFVDALTHLGGPQVATPKQIRELMRVDGLTNDQVKSHLQKYRLHSRRVPNKSAASNDNGLASSCPSVDQYCDSSKPSSLQSGSPEGPLQFPGVTGGTSTTAGDSMEDVDDEKSETYSWKPGCVDA